MCLRNSVYRTLGTSPYSQFSLAHGHSRARGCVEMGDTCTIFISYMYVVCVCRDLPSREIVKVQAIVRLSLSSSASGDTASLGLRTTCVAPADSHMVAVQGLTPIWASGALHLKRYPHTAFFLSSPCAFRSMPAHQWVTRGQSVYSLSACHSPLDHTLGSLIGAAGPNLAQLVRLGAA